MLNILLIILFVIRLFSDYGVVDGVIVIVVEEDVVVVLFVFGFVVVVVVTVGFDEVAGFIIEFIIADKLSWAIGWLAGCETGAGAG